LESSSAKSIYQSAYGVLRDHTAAHQNAFFNIVDLGLNGPNPARDSQTLALLDAWLLRLTRDFAVDLHGVVPVCGDQACQPAPVWLRPPTDFLWQRSPFQLAVGGAGIIQSAGSITSCRTGWRATTASRSPSWWYRRRLRWRWWRRLRSVPFTARPWHPLRNKRRRSRCRFRSEASASPCRIPPETSASARLLYVSPGQINFLMPSVWLPVWLPSPSPGEPARRGRQSAQWDKSLPLCSA